MDTKKYNKEYVNTTIKNGNNRVSKENRVLQLMFDGFRVIEFNKIHTDLANIIYLHCELDSYTEGIEHVYGPNLMAFSNDLKIVCNCILAFDSLWKRDLVDREVFILHSDKLLPVSKDSSLETYFEIVNPIKLADYIMNGTSGEVDKSFTSKNGILETKNLTVDNITYKINSKGYDVALKLQEHKDQKERFEQQNILTQHAVKASQSSADSAKRSRKIATRALWIVSFVALGSIGNLVFRILMHFNIV